MSGEKDECNLTRTGTGFDAFLPFSPLLHGGTVLSTTNNPFHRNVSLHCMRDECGLDLWGSWSRSVVGLQPWCEDDGDRERWRGGADDGLLGESDGRREGRVKKLARFSTKRLQNERSRKLHERVGRDSRGTQVRGRNAASSYSKQPHPLPSFSPILKYSTSDYHTTVLQLTPTYFEMPARVRIPYISHR
jgi:hypothetical protein